ncbi:MAG: ATP-binding protein [bacterium]
MRLSFQTRMLLGFGGITALVFIALLGLTDRWIAARAEGDVRARLAQDARVLSRVHATASRLRAQQLRSIAQEPRMLALTEVHDVATLRFAAEEELADLRLSSFAFLGSDGEVLVWTGKGRGEIEPRLDRLLRRPNLTRALPDTVRVGEAGVEVQVVPLTVGDETRGYLVASREMDQGVLQDYALAVGDRVELRSGGHVLVASPPDPVDEGHLRTLDVELGGALKLVVGVDENLFTEPLRSAFRAILLLSVSGAVLGSLVAFFAARRFTAPLAALAATARSVGAGNFAVRAAETGAPELVDLARAFNQTIDSLLRTQRELQASAAGLREKTRELETIGAALTEFLESGDWHRASERLLAGALAQTHSRGGLVGVVLPGSRFKILAAEGPDGPIPPAPDRKIEAGELTGLVGSIIRTGRPVSSANLADDPATDDLLSVAPRLGQFLGVPIRRGNEVVGVLGVANESGYTETERAQLELLANAAGVLIDGYRRHQAEESLQAQLRQSQKMEAVGRLAGGIAHDFNNLLTVIRGQTELLLRRLRVDEPNHRYATQALKAADRAAALTRQLLAFGRSPIGQVRVVDLNLVIVDMVEMLRRLVRSDVELTTRLDPSMGRIDSDPSQLEQVIMNLVLNARDAMPSGGRLEIETSTTRVAADDPTRPVDRPPGDYATLAVRDTGVGMDDATLSRIFEPFFTTKEEGRGTGLGLATVYGIVRQSGGYIVPSSVVGKGSTFVCHFPISQRTDEDRAPSPEQRPSIGGTERVLVVEDEAMVRSFVREVLSEAGYRVLEAAGAEEALGLCGEQNGSLDLLLTDVVMPNMSGVELAERATQRAPSLKVVFMSGFAEEAFGGVVDAERVLLRKPFTSEALLRTLRRVLDAESRSPGSAC